MNHDFLERYIEEAYKNFGFDQGWRLWYHPRALADSRLPVLVMPINPGVGGNWQNHPRYSQERGSAFKEEEWGPLSQMKDPIPELLSLAGLNIERLLYANWVPFRSNKEQVLTKHPKWSEINEWCVDLWRQILAEIEPRLILSFGSTPRDGLRSVLGLPSDTREEKVPRLCTFRLDVYSGRKLRVMALPYPKTQSYSLLDQPVRPITDKWLRVLKKSATTG
ncbi:MAG: hypothetical protein WBN89_03695 [Prochlorococcaceae cyanobacterium]